MKPQILTPADRAKGHKKNNQWDDHGWEGQGGEREAREGREEEQGGRVEGEGVWEEGEEYRREAGEEKDSWGGGGGGRGGASGHSLELGTDPVLTLKRYHFLPYCISDKLVRIDNLF